MTAWMSTRRSVRYQVFLAGILSLNFGILFFDRNALNMLMPFVKADLRLSNTQTGLLASALSLSWAISGFAVGRYSDRTGHRKAPIVIATIIFSVCSFVSGIATNFLALFGSRLLMGLAEGGVLPISQSLIGDEVVPDRRGLAMGIMQNLCSNLLGCAIGPVVLVAVAEHFGWRSTFFLAGIPGLLSALVIWRFVRLPQKSIEAGAPEAPLSIREAFGHRNIRLCALISVLLVSYVVVFWAFMPLFLTQVRGYSAEAMGLLMATGGISAAFAGFVVPGLSDYIGRKPVMIMVPLLGAFLPLGAIYYLGSGPMLAVLFFIGWTLNGVFPLYMAIIPSETVDPRHTATVLGLVMGVGEVVGGVISPAIAGATADVYGLSAPLWVMLGLCLAAGVLATGLTETAPRKVAGAREHNRRIAATKSTR